MSRYPHQGEVLGLEEQMLWAAYTRGIQVGQEQGTRRGISIGRNQVLRELYKFLVSSGQIPVTPKSRIAALGLPDNITAALRKEGIHFVNELIDRGGELGRLGFSTAAIRIMAEKLRAAGLVT